VWQKPGTANKWVQRKWSPSHKKEAELQKGKRDGREDRPRRGEISLGGKGETTQYPSGNHQGGGEMKGMNERRDCLENHAMDCSCRKKKSPFLMRSCEEEEGRG